MLEELSIQESNIEFNERSSTVWVPVQVAVTLLWKDNAKLHSLGSIKDSILRYGLRDKVIFDASLPNVSGGAGAIQSGNGRTEALAQMEYDPTVTECPRGLGIDKESGAWVMPIEYGTDANSLSQAISYAIDANNLTMMGGMFDDFEIAKMWDPQGHAKAISNLLEEGDAMPVSIAEDDAPYLINALLNVFPTPDEPLPPPHTGLDDTLFRYVVYGLTEEEAGKLKMQNGRGSVEEYNTNS